MGTGSISSEVSASCQEQEQQILKQQYHACWATQTNLRGSLRQLICRLIELRTSREQLLEWALEAGASQRSAQKRISEVLCDLGLRQRQPGGGRSCDPLSLEYLDLACAEHGLERAQSILHGAARAADAKVRRLARQRLQNSSLIPDRNKQAGRSGPLVPDGNKASEPARPVIPDGNKDLTSLPPTHLENISPSQSQL